MKLSALLFTATLLILTACTPNRLTNSLPPPIEEQPASVAAIATPTPDQPEAAPAPSGRNLQPQLALAQIDPNEVVALLPPDGIPAIMPEDAPNIYVSAEDADAAGMSPSTRVLGLSINGDSRAYPIPYMSSHEIVNDEVGGELIAATW